MTISSADIRQFVEKHVKSSVGYFDKNNIYPTELVEIMKSMGLFGLTIPKMYDGLEVDVVTRLQVIEELASAWLSLCSILDSHLRVCDFIIKYGTDEQKTKYLPLLAKGQLIAANANNEKNMKQIEILDTSLESVKDSLETWMLSGRKEWITNSRNADIFAVSARVVSHQHPDLKCFSTCVVLVLKHTDGVLIQNDWDRMGVKGISLAPVVFQNCLVETKNIIGEFLYDGKTLIESSFRNLSMVSSARSIGISKGLIEKCAVHLVTRKRNGIVGSLSEDSVVCMRFGEMVTQFEAANSLFKDCCSNLDSKKPSSFLACKVFATKMAKEVALSCMQLFGGAGYTSEFEIERCVRDALSLPIIHSPSDVALTRIGKIVLNDFKIKQEHPPSIVLDYAPDVLPHMKREYLLRATLKEQEKIIDTGYYRNTNIQLYIYDMTTWNPSGTFKDLLGCLTFAHCSQNNIHRICAQSSGNAAMSLMHYARKHPHIKLIQFYLRQNSFKIDPAIIPQNVILVENSSTEADMKKSLKRFSDLAGIPIMPNLQLQIDANKLRAYFLNDIYVKEGLNFDWYVQSLSSAYGPIGLYTGFTDIIQQQKQSGPPPKFLGVQQEAVCPFVRALGYQDNGIVTDDKQVEIIEPTLFRSDPGDDLINKVKNILDTYGGKLLALTNNDFKKYLNEALELLSKHNIQITKTNENNIVEKAGILALIATLRELDDIDHGTISPNSKVLIGFTGGTRGSSREKLKPKVILDKDPTDEQLKAILQYL